jgi:hypothetical protein
MHKEANASFHRTNYNFSMGLCRETREFVNALHVPFLVMSPSQSLSIATVSHSHTPTLPHSHTLTLPQLLHTFTTITTPLPPSLIPPPPRSKYHGHDRFPAVRHPNAVRSRSSFPSGIRSSSAGVARHVSSWPGCGRKFKRC